MKVRQMSPTPCSLVHLKGRAIATYDVAAFLDARGHDLGGRVAAGAARGPVYKRENERAEIIVAFVVILASLSVIAYLLLELQHP